VSAQPTSFLEQHLSGGVWRADRFFSSVTFKVRHLGLRDYRAGFAEIDATLDVAEGTLTATVPVKSLDLNNPVIRERMLSAEFLDAARFPDVRWVVSGFDGDLATRAITVDRRDFGLDWQEALPTGGDTLGYDVTLEAVLEFVEDE